MFRYIQILKNYNIRHSDYQLPFTYNHLQRLPSLSVIPVKVRVDVSFHKMFFDEDVLQWIVWQSKFSNDINIF